MLDTLAHLFTPRHTNNHRPRLLHPDGLVVVSAVVLVFNILIRTTPVIASLGHVLGYSSSITANQVLDQINAVRQREGLEPLVINHQLNSAAISKGSDMFTEQYWAHESPGGVEPWAFIQGAGYKYSVAGENLARDFDNTTSMVEAWMASPSHKKNLLSGKYTETGIAVIDGQLMGVETTLVVQMFGRPLQAYTPPVETETKNPPLITDSAEKTTTLGTIAPASTIQGIDGETATPFFSPLQLSKAVALAALALLISILGYDLIIATRKHTVRIVGKNIAHIALFSVVGIAIVLFKGGLLS